MVCPTILVIQPHFLEVHDSRQANRNERIVEIQYHQNIINHMIQTESNILLHTTNVYFHSKSVYMIPIVSVCTILLWAQ